MVKRNHSKSIDLSNETILKRIKEMKADHPVVWSYRRVWAYLKCCEDLEIDKKRVYQLLKEDKKFLELQTSRNQKKRTPKRSRLKTSQLRTRLGIST